MSPEKNERGRLTRWWFGWVSFLAHQESGLSLAIFRLGVSAALLGSLLTTLEAGLVGPIWIDASAGGAFHIGARSSLVSLLGGSTPGVVWSVFALGLFAAVSLAVGLQGRVSALVALQAYQGLYSSNSLASSAYDLLITNALWLCVLGDTSRTLSLDAWRRTKRFVSDEPVSAWPRYLAIFQILVVYTATGLQKVSAVWTSQGGYSAIYWVLQDPNWRRFDGRFAATIYPITQVGTAVTWFFEVLSPLMLLFFYFRRTPQKGGRIRAWMQRHDLRLLYLGIGVALHLSVLLTMNVGVFSIIATSFYVTFFRPDELVAFRARWRRWRRSPER